MAGNDPRGIQLLDACRRAGVAVPEEVAVVGVDNDELVCELAYPPLSSVIPDAVRIGYEAAALLDRLMKGEPAPAAMQTIPPQGLAIRQSSDVTAIADPRLADAMRFIREHACDGIGVDDVLDHLAVSRSVLQRLFRKHFDRTILDTITGVRIARVKQLLTETDLPLAAIAQRAGFSYMEYLSNTFRRQTGWTPSAFRREFARREGLLNARDTARSSTRSRRIESVRSNGHPSRRSRHDHDPENRPVLHAGRPARRRGRSGGGRSTDLDPPLQQGGRPAPRPARRSSRRPAWCSISTRTA